MTGQTVAPGVFGARPGVAAGLPPGGQYGERWGSVGCAIERRTVAPSLLHPVRAADTTRQGRHPHVAPTRCLSVSGRGVLCLGFCHSPSSDHVFTPRGNAFEVRVTADSWVAASVVCHVCRQGGMAGRRAARPADRQTLSPLAPPSPHRRAEPARSSRLWRAGYDAQCSPCHCADCTGMGSGRRGSPRPPRRVLYITDRALVAVFTLR